MNADSQYSFFCKPGSDTLVPQAGAGVRPSQAQSLPTIQKYWALNFLQYQVLLRNFKNPIRPAIRPTRTAVPGEIAALSTGRKNNPYCGNVIWAATNGRTFFRVGLSDGTVRTWGQARIGQTDVKRMHRDGTRLLTGCDFNRLLYTMGLNQSLG